MEGSIQYIAELMKANTLGFHCFSPDSYSVRGVVGADEGSALILNINKCTGKDNCKSEEEIAEFLKDKVVYFLQNTSKYQAEVYGDDSIKHRIEHKLFNLDSS